MEHGDLSNAVPPRFLFVFEGLIASVPTEQKPVELGLVQFRRWKRAARLWRIDEYALSVVWDHAWRHAASVDMVTFLPGPYAEAIAERLDSESVPYGNLIVTTPDILARRIVYMPDVQRIFYAQPERPFLFGDRGNYVPKGAGAWMSSGAF